MGFTDLNGGGGPSSGGYGPVPTPVYRYLDTNGDGTGVVNARGDYSLSEEIFYIQPAPGEIIRLERMMVLIEGNKGTFYTDGYGGIAGGLTNGIQVRVQDDNGTITDLTAGLPVLSNGMWGGLCYDAEIYPASTGNNDTYLRVRWTFARSGYPLRLVGDNNERLEVVLNDNFAGVSGSKNLIEKHYFHVQGYYEGTT